MSKAKPLDARTLRAVARNMAKRALGVDHSTDPYCIGMACAYRALADRHDATQHELAAAQMARADVENTLTETLAELADERAKREQAEPVPMFLSCPACTCRHIDEGEFATKRHHTHSCQECGLTWRPAACATVGVQFLPGFKNEQPSTEQPGEDAVGQDSETGDGIEFGCNPGDSAALEKLRMAIDDNLIWPSDIEKETGDYESAVRHSGELALRFASLRERDAECERHEGALSSVGAAAGAKCKYCNRAGCESEKYRDDARLLRMCRHAVQLERDFLLKRVARLESALRSRQIEAIDQAERDQERFDAGERAGYERGRRDGLALHDDDSPTEETCEFHSGNESEFMRECAVCELVQKLRLSNALLSKLQTRLLTAENPSPVATATKAAPGRYGPLGQEPERCNWVSGFGNRCVGKPGHVGAHATSPGDPEPSATAVAAEQCGWIWSVGGHRCLLGAGHDGPHHPTSTVWVTDPSPPAEEEPDCSSPSCGMTARIEGLCIAHFQQKERDRALFSVTRDIEAEAGKTAEKAPLPGGLGTVEALRQQLIEAMLVADRWTNCPGFKRVADELAKQGGGR